MAEQLRPLLDELLAAPKKTRSDHGVGGTPKTAGVYLFSDEKGVPQYVGQSRNLRRRLALHCRPSSRHNQASFAFRIAQKTAAGAGVNIAGFRAEVAAQADFKEHFKAAKEQVAEMGVQFVEEDGPELRTVFEVYATYALGTQEFNKHETH
ncbi:MAG TPA: GIY-YIG nuclease family protein [Baekduia sp.]|jgi:hypothetical protein|nr:GIY-YIG nuclease family protein [Baekduia sp.]